MSKDKNKKSVAAESLVSLDNMQKKLEEATKSTIKNLLSDAVRNVMNESITEADEDEFEVEDVTDTVDDSETPETDTEVGDDIETDVDVDMDTEAPEADIDADVSGGDEWAEFDQYKTNDGEYDFSDVEDDETIVKVYKLLKNDDEVVIKQDGDKIDIKDNETGAEYVVDLAPDTDTSLESDMGDFGEDDSLEDDGEEDMFEIDLSRLAANLVAEANINLGYTDNYQDTDVMTNPGMSEPAKSSETNDWDKGVPNGTEKRWAGDSKSKGDPFDKTVSENDEPEETLEEEENIEEITTVTSNNARKVPKTHTSQPRADHIPYGSKHISVGSDYKENVAEALIKKAKMIEEENAELKKALGKFKNALQEAALVNVNLGQIVKLITENSTSKNEKISIVTRFGNEAKTIEQSKSLYESINRQLKEKGNQTVVVEKQMSANGSAINETTVYRSPDMLKTIGLMNRMGMLK